MKRSIGVLAVAMTVAASALAQPTDPPGDPEPAVAGGTTSSAEPVSPDAAAPVFEAVPTAADAELQPRLPPAAGEDEGAPVPTAEGETVREPIPVPGVPVDPPAAPVEESTWDWLDSLPEDAPVLEWSRGSYTLAPIGLIQLAVVPWQGDGARIATGQYVDEEGFRFRMARAGLQGYAGWGMSYRFQAEFTDDGAELLDAVLSYEPHPAFRLNGGAGKVGFSGSMLTPTAFLTFLSRPWGVDGETGDGRRVGIAPGRSLGAWIDGAYSVIRYNVGVYNGNRDYFVGNDNSGMLYSARVECLPLGDLPEGQLEVEGGEPRLRIGAAYYYNQDSPGDTHGVEGDLKFRWKGLVVEGEFLWSRFLAAGDPELPGGETADIDRWGYYGQVGYIVWPKWLDIAARFEGFLLDDGVDDFNDRWAIGGVATLFLMNNRVKLQLEYQHLQEAADPQVENDSLALQLQGRF